MVFRGTSQFGLRGRLTSDVFIQDVVQEGINAFLQTGEHYRHPESNTILKGSKEHGIVQCGDLVRLSKSGNVKGSKQHDSSCLLVTLSLVTTIHARNHLVSTVHLPSNRYQLLCVYISLRQKSSQNRH